MNDAHWVHLLQNISSEMGLAKGDLPENQMEILEKAQDKVDEAIGELRVLAYRQMKQDA